MNTYNKIKVIIGLSGGVDSAVAACLLKKQNYDLSAVFLQCWKEPGCRANQDREDALKVALALNIPFQVLDFSKEYKEKVLNYFYNEYQSGNTPNPDILCNSVIKFGLFYEWAIKQGFNYIATGHYAKIIDGHLAIPKDVKKDQTYFLYQIPQDRLKHVIFPLNDYLKSEVREIAQKQKLTVANKPDSMGICFVGDIDVPSFLKQKFGVKKGLVQLSGGEVIGEHDGYYLFTIGKRGQWRRKRKINDSKLKNDQLPKLYVIDIRPKENIVVVGEREEAEKKKFNIKNLLLNPKEVENVYIRIRNTGSLIPAKLIQQKKNIFQANLEKAEFGVSKGQSAVIYKKLGNSDNFIILGGGEIFY